MQIASAVYQAGIVLRGVLHCGELGAGELGLCSATGERGEGVRTLDTRQGMPTPGAPRIRIRMVGLSEPLWRPIFWEDGGVALGEVCLFNRS